MQAASQARAAAAATVNESIRVLERYHQGVNPSTRLLQSKLDQLIADKERLVAKHYVYGEKSNKKLDSDEMLQWITPYLDRVLDLSDAVFLQIDNLEANAASERERVEQQAITTARASEVLIAELQYKANENSLRERIVSMMVIADDQEKSTVDDANILRSYLHQIDDSMSEQVKSWNLFKSLGPPPEKVTAVFNEEQILRKYVADSCLKASTRISKIQPESTPSLNESTASAADSSMRNHNTNSIKSEKIKNPTFSGDLRSFARFKKDFEDIVVSNHPDSKYQTYVLKESCLLGEAKKLVANMTDLAAIW